MIINDKLFNLLKWLTLVIVPAVNASTFSILQLWGVDPEITAKLTGSIAILNTLLGVAIGVSAIQYNRSDEKYDGIISPKLADLQTSETALSLGPLPTDLENKKDVLLKVETPASPVIPEY